MSAPTPRRGAFGQVVHELEETMIALLLGLMTLVTFANVVLRYGYNSQLIWGLELTLVLFAWLVLFGIAYGFKVTAHLGVDALLNVVPRPLRYAMGIASALACLVYALLLLKGAWDYWAPFAGLNATSGRWLPGVITEGGWGSWHLADSLFVISRDQAWYETEQLPIPFAKDWLEATFNLGEEYEKMPRFVPYVILPVSMALMLLRLVQATIRLIRGEIDSLIVSHEAEDAVEEAGAALKGGEAR